MADEATVPSLQIGGVGSRFVTQGEIDDARARKDEQWKAAYARLGQEPPPQPTADAYDGRSLAEKLAANKIAKQEEFEERMKLKNQFRSLEEDEVMFLDSILEKERNREQAIIEQDKSELAGYREAVAKRDSTSLPPPLTSSPSASKSKPTTSAPAKKDTKKNTMRGVIVKKKPKEVNTNTPAAKAEKRKADEKTSDTEPEPPSKRRPSKA